MPPPIIIDLNLIIEPSLNSTQKEKSSLHAHAFVQWLLTYPSKIRKSTLPIVITSSPSHRGQLHIEIQQQQLESPSCAEVKKEQGQEKDNGSHEDKVRSNGNDDSNCDIINALLLDDDSDEEKKNQREKTIHTALKKISIEDLGNMNAAELQSSIPNEDSEGRGMKDLHYLEKKLSVKVVFDNVTNHVLLVGEKKKLDKKVFEIRNMLSHYHWRLCGSDVVHSSK